MSGGAEWEGASDLERVPPHSLEAERGLLDCLLEDREEAEGCVGRLVERLINVTDFFYDVRHGQLWQHIKTMHQAGQPVSPETLIVGLRMADQMPLVEVVTELQGKGPTPANFEFHFKACAETWKLRRQVRACSLAVEKIFDPATQKRASEVIAEVEKDILDVKTAQEESTVVPIKSICLEVLEAMDGYVRGEGLNKGMKTGFDYFDKMTTGFYGQEYHVLAGRPGTGKTSLALNMVNHICVESGVPTLVYSLEMTKLQLGFRMMAQRAWVDFQRLRTGYLVDKDCPKLSEAGAKIAKSPLFIDDLGKQSILSMRSKARRLWRQHGIGFIVIDYLQLVAPPQKDFSREQEVSAVSGEILEMAKELEIPVLVLAQLNRQIEQNDRWRPPRLSDLRESGQVEQDAHSVTILYKPKLKPGISDDMDKELEMVNDPDWSKRRVRVNGLICKQRNGPTGDCEFVFWKDSMNFVGFDRGKEL